MGVPESERRTGNRLRLVKTIVEPHGGSVVAHGAGRGAWQRIYGAVAVAERLFSSVHTVETHCENIKRELNVGNLSELNRRAVLWVSRRR